MYNNNRNKVHNKCSALESFQIHLSAPLSVEKLSSTKLVRGARKVGDLWFKPLDSEMVGDAAIAN